jgi:hypothetical protein
MTLDEKLDEVADLCSQCLVEKRGLLEVRDARKWTADAERFPEDAIDCGPEGPKPEEVKGTVLKILNELAQKGDIDMSEPPHGDLKQGRIVPHGDLRLSIVYEFLETSHWYIRCWYYPSQT